MSGEGADKTAKAHDLESRRILMHGLTPEPATQLANEIAVTGPKTDPLDSMTRLQKRKELYAISNLVMREILPRVDAWIHEHPGVVPEYADEIEDASQPFSTVPLADSAARFHEFVKSGKGRLQLPEFGYGRVLLKHLVEWESGRGAFTPEARALYDRFVSVIKVYRPTNVKGLKDYPASCFIWRGGNTASEFPWNLAKLLPVRWFQLTGKTITPEEFKTALNDIGTMLTTQSSMRLERFDVLERVMQFDGAKMVTYWQEVENRAKFITFIPGANGMRIALDNKRLEEWLDKHPPSELERDTIAIGCPGRDVRTPAANPARGGELVDPMTSAYEFNVPIAEAFFCPVLEEYTERYLEHAGTQAASWKEQSA